MKKLLFLMVVIGLFLVLPNVVAESCTDLDGDSFFTYNETLCPLGNDCDDNNTMINPNATEIPYDGIDQNCNGFDLLDVDVDGYDYPEDCDDNNTQIHPNATEIPNDGIDQDCSGSDLTYSCIDLDVDGFFTYNETLCPLGNDCDDNNSMINPNASEVYYNGVDDDCNSSTIDNDKDGDGSPFGEDCDDNNKLRSPKFNETPNNGVDDDCNSTTLDDDADQDGVNDTKDNCVNKYNPGQEDADSDGIGNICDSVCTDGLDNDGDGFIDEHDPGCYDSGSYDKNDGNETDILAECSDNFDNDGDGSIDDEDKGCYTNGVYNPNDDSELGPGVGPGITPDSPLWGLDRAIERIRYILTFGKSAKAKQGLAHALERLMEVREMIQQKKLIHAQRAQRAFEEDMGLVEGLVDKLGEGDDEDELETELEIEKMLTTHARLVKNIKLKITNMTQEQQRQAEELLNSIEESNNNIEAKIKTQKHKTKIKIMAKQGITSEEAAEIENRIRERLGITPEQIVVKETPGAAQEDKSGKGLGLGHEKQEETEGSDVSQGGEEASESSQSTPGKGKAKGVSEVTGSIVSTHGKASDSSGGSSSSGSSGSSGSSSGSSSSGSGGGSGSSSGSGSGNSGSSSGKGSGQGNKK